MRDLDWRFWLYLAAWLPYTLTALFYGFGSTWWTTPIGRSLLLSKAAIVAVLTNVLLALIIPGYMIRNEFRVALIGGVVIAGWYQFSAILREQRKARDELHKKIQRSYEEIP